MSGRLDSLNNVAEPGRRQLSSAGTTMRISGSSTVWISFGILLVAAWPHAVAKTAETPDYWLSPDPTFELVHIRFDGGMTKAQLDYRLYADGRFTVEHGSGGEGGTVYSSAEVHLTAEEVEGLVRDAVTGGLLAVSEEARDKIRTLERRFFASDSGSVFITFAVPNVRMPGSNSETTITTKLAMRAGTYRRANDRAPEIPELAAVEQLVSAFRAHGKRAQEAQE